VDGLAQVPSPGVNQQSRAAIVAEEAALTRESGKGRGVELTGERYSTSAPRVGEEVSEDRVDGRSQSAHLHDLARPGWVEVVEVPAGDFPGLTADWLSDADIAVLDTTYRGRVSRSLTVDEFRMKR